MVAVCGPVLTVNLDYSSQKPAGTWEQGKRKRMLKVRLRGREKESELYARATYPVLHRGVHRGAGDVTGLDSQECGLDEPDSDLGAATDCCWSALGTTKGMFGDICGCVGE